MRNVPILAASVALALSLASASPAAHANETGEATAPELSFLTPGTKSAARLAALADSASTLAAISAGASELNPLVNANPVGLLVLAGLKFGFVELADRMPEEQRHKTLRFSTALWSGVSVSNVLVAASLANPAAWVVGAATGWYVWAKGGRAEASVAAGEQAPSRVLAANVSTATENKGASAE